MAYRHSIQQVSVCVLLIVQTVLLTFAKEALSHANSAVHIFNVILHT